MTGSRGRYRHLYRTCGLPPNHDGTVHLGVTGHPLIKGCASPGGWCCVDEAFVGLEPDVTPQDGSIVRGC